MTRQLERGREDRWRKRADRLARACEDGLTDAVGHAGGELTGVSVRIDPYECVMTIKAIFPAGPMVGFVGAGSLGDCVLKAERDSHSDQVRWRPDKWAKK